MPEPVACPQCRHAPVQTATPSRVAKTMVKFLLERYPAAARPPNELKQAEEIYTAARGTLKVTRMSDLLLTAVPYTSCSSSHEPERLLEPLSMVLL